MRMIAAFAFFFRHDFFSAAPLPAAFDVYDVSLLPMPLRRRFFFMPMLMLPRRRRILLMLRCFRHICRYAAC